MFDIHQTVFDAHDNPDQELVRGYVNGLMKEFAMSPEAQGLAGEFAPYWARVLLDYHIDYVGGEFAFMTQADFTRIVFGLFPKKVAVDPEAAGEMIEELRAFWAFVDRQFGHPHAKPILRSLSGDSVNTLNRRLADRSRYGFAKALYMDGVAAGFDMTNEGDMNRFVNLVNLQQTGRLIVGDLPDFGGDPYLGLPHVSELPSFREKKRKSRKAQRQARKRNRKR